LDEVHVYIHPPSDVPAKLIQVKIDPSHLLVGIKGNPPYLDCQLHMPVVAKQSFWMLEDGVLHIQLEKMDIGQTWVSLFQGHESLNPIEAQHAQQQMLLQRFQRENPGFDFSGAKFSGSAPDARKFMGGLDYNRL